MTVYVVLHAVFDDQSGHGCEALVRGVYASRSDAVELSRHPDHQVETGQFYCCSVEAFEVTAARAEEAAARH